jgi:hypothetical protein
MFSFAVYTKKERSTDALHAKDVIHMFSLVNSYPIKSLGFRSPITLIKAKHRDGLLELLDHEEIPLTQLNFKRIHE